MRLDPQRAFVKLAALGRKRGDAQKNVICLRWTKEMLNETGNIDEAGTAKGVTVDPEEVAFFAKIADSWWDPHGPFKPLHQLNPTRLEYIRREVTKHFDLDDTSVAPFEGLRLLDIGCGGGLISEPMRRLGADVVAVDASEKNIKTASVHAETNGLEIDFRNDTAEALAAAGEQFDVIINMEVIEHVADVDAYLAACRKLLKPSGIMLLSTINRTPKAYLFAIIGAERVMRWLPVGAHDWNKFITPGELADFSEKVGFAPTEATGFVYNPLSGKWRLHDSDFGVNYAMAAKGS